MNNQQPPRIVDLSGSLTIERASDLKAEFQTAFSASGNVLVDLTSIDDMDLACLQVLYSARRTARESGREFHLKGTVQPRIVKRLAACGFLQGSPGRAEEFEANLVDF